MLLHMPCGTRVTLDSQGVARCPGCGKAVRVKVSKK